MAVPNPLSAKEAESGRKALCSSAASDPALEGVLRFTGQETRAWHEASFKKEHRKPSCQTSPCDAARFPAWQLNGKAEGNGAKAVERTALILQPAVRLPWTLLLLPGPSFVLHPQLDTDHSNYHLLPCQRGEKERRDGRRKAVILMGSAFKFIYWEKMARTKLCFSNFAWWVFST